MKRKQVAQVAIGDNLRLENKDGTLRYICACGHILGPGEVNYKEHCLVKESSASAADPVAAYDREMAGKMCSRIFLPRMRLQACHGGGAAGRSLPVGYPAANLRRDSICRP